MNNNFDLIIIGGGAAGIMSAISAKRKNSNLTVCIVDRTFALGRKILVCGAGRCNITNINLDNDFKKRYYSSLENQLIENVIKQFDLDNIQNFFKELGVELYVERKTNIGKVFPVTDQAKTVTALLESELKRLGVEIFLNTEVTSVKKLNDEFNVVINSVKLNERQIKEYNPKKTFADGDILKSKFLILSAGGKTYPALGSNGSGYSIANTLGHTIIEPVPSALPVVLTNNPFKELFGQKLECEVTSIISDKEIKKSIDDLMFTDYGLSGPSILNISREISIEINRFKRKNTCKISINFFPNRSKEEVKELLSKRIASRPNTNFQEILYGIYPNRVADFLAKKVGMYNERNVDINEEMLSTLTKYIVNVESTKSWNEAEFTSGGISINEVNEKTLESKIIPSLYFAGEILDVDGDVGGFNLSWAWSSGFVAGLLN